MGIKDLEDGSAVEAMRLELENRIWRERDAQKQREDDARAYLLAQTLKGREAQLASKAEQDAIDAVEGAAYAKKFREDYQESVDLANAEVAKRKLDLLENQRELRAQIERREQARVEEEQAKYLGEKMMAREEEITSKRLGD